MSQGVEHMPQAVEQGTSDLRLYATPWGLFPSVTTVLSNAEGEKAWARLRHWGEQWEKEEGSKGATHPTVRGTMVDDLICSFLSLPLEVRQSCPLPSPDGFPADVQPYIRSLHLPMKNTGKSILYNFGEVLWCQQLLAHVNIVPDERRLFRQTRKGLKEYVASRELGIAGTPDVIAEYNGELSLISIKTSKEPYSRQHPGWENLPKGAKPTPEWSRQYGAWAKFSRAVQQEEAYCAAVKETLGLYLTKVIILCITPTGVKVFRPTEVEREKGKKRLKKAIDKFRSMYPALVPTDDMLLR